MKRGFNLLILSICLVAIVYYLSWSFELLELVVGILGAIIGLLLFYWVRRNLYLDFLGLYGYFTEENLAYNCDYSIVHKTKIEDKDFRYSYLLRRNNDKKHHILTNNNLGEVGMTFIKRHPDFAYEVDEPFGWG